MPVVINDFEVIVEPERSGNSTQTPAASVPAPPAPLRPEDVEQIVQHFQERRARVMAD